MKMQYVPPEEDKDPIKAYTINTTRQAEEGALDPVIGRNEEIRRVMQILARRTKNNPVLLGDPGVGKTAIVEGLAQRISSGDVPETLKNKEVLALDLATLVAGSSFRGQFEDRLKKLLKYIDKAAGKYILFMDELHTLVGAGAAQGAVDAANILKPALARGKLRAIGATTLKEYRKYIEKDAALERRFQPVYVDEPVVEDTIAILRGIKEKYEVHHGIRITDDALIAASVLSNRYIADRFLPDKAIDLVDEAASALKIEAESMPYVLDQLKRELTQNEIELAAVKKERKEVAKDKRKKLEEKIKKLKKKEKELTKKWKYQKEIISKLQKNKVELDRLKIELNQAERDVKLDRAAELKYGEIPKVEKELKEAENEWNKIPDQDKLIQEEVTEEDIARVVSKWTGIPVTKLLASEAEKLLSLESELKKQIVGQDQALKEIASAIRRNRVGIAEPSRPIGVFLFLGPTGVGKTETSKALARYLFDDEKNIVRIDMSEYQERHSVARLIGAPPGYVGYEEGGQLTESVRRRPYSVVLFDEIEKAHPQVFNLFLQIFDEGKLTDGKGRTVDFRNSIIIMTSNLGSDKIAEFKDKDEEQAKSKVMEIVRKSFLPEFINRLDKTIIYNRLNKQVMQKIVDIQLDRVTKRLEDQNIKAKYTDSLRKHLSEEGFDEIYGARPLKRLIQDTILDEVALKILEGKIKERQEAVIDYKNGKVEVVLK